MRYDNKNKTILLPKPLLGSLGRNFFRYLLVGSQKVTIFAPKRIKEGLCVVTILF